MRSLAIVLAGLTGCAALVGQVPATNNQPASAVPVIHSTMREVLLDVVVRDKHERLITDLKPEDIEIYEDGVRQTAKSFKAVTGQEQTEFEQRERASAAPGMKNASGLNALRQINLVSIVFTRMSPRSRDFAREAVQSFLKNQLLANTFGAVYSLDYKLNALQPYTNDLQALLKATDHAAQGAYSQYGTDNENVLNQLEVTINNVGGNVNIFTSFDPNQLPQMALSGADVAVGTTALIQAKMISDLKFITSDNEGLRTLEALKIFVRRQAVLPGRKTVIFLGEGLPVPPERPEMLQAVIAEANAANVSFYAIDVRGLSTKSSSSLATSELRNRASQTGDWRTVGGTTPTPATGSDPGSDGNNPNTVFNTVPGGSGGTDMHVDDSLLLAVHADTQLSMRELAESTGGFLVANTNDIEVPMRRVMEDVRAHYELAYSPSSQVFDGHFRKVEVRLRRSGLKVQTRSGYFALPDAGGEPTKAYEVAALTAMTLSPQPHAIDYSAGVLDFGPVGNSVQCVVSFEVPKSAIRVIQDPVSKKQRLHASLVGIVKNEKGQIAGKVSRDLDLEVPEDQLASLRTGNLIFSQWLELRPGKYTLESAVLDQGQETAGVHRAAIEVDDPGKPGLSSIAVVRRVDAFRGERDPLDPLQFRNGRVVPALGGKVQSGQDASLYFVLYPMETSDGKPDLTKKPQVTVEFYLDGKLIADANPEFRTVEGMRAIPVFLSAKFNPGEYMAKVRVQQGDAVTERSTAFEVLPASQPPGRP